MAKIEHVHHRLERWALWKTKGGSLAGGSSSMAMWANVQVDCAGRKEAAIPVDDSECGITDGCIKALPEPLAETVARYYLEDSDRTRRKLAISSATLSQRLDRAHKLLDEAFRVARPAGPVGQQLPTGWLKA
jgi:hypothetical protein